MRNNVGLMARKPRPPQHEVYVPSGRVAWHAPFKLMFFGVPGAILLAWLYAKWLSSGPAVLALPGYGLFCLLLGLHARKVLKAGHSRSRRFNVWSAVFLGGVALWAHWLLWIRMSFESGEALAMSFATSSPLGWPGFFAMLAERLAQTDPDRFMLHGLRPLWAVEALMAVWLAVVLARGQAGALYSETRRRWATQDGIGALRWVGSSAAEFKKQFDERGVAFLLTLPRVEILKHSEEGPDWRVMLSCSQVKEDPVARWVSLVCTRQIPDGKGGRRSETALALSDWAVGGDEFEALLGHLRDESMSAVEPPGPRKTPDELAPAVAALEAESFERALQMAEGFCAHPDMALRADALRLCALSQARLENWEKAFDNYYALFAIELGVLNALQLATTSVMAGHLAQGESWFEKARQINDEKQEMPWPGLYTNFLSALAMKGEWAAGLPHVEWLRDMFQGMSNSDDTFVFMHGMPFLSVFFEKSLPFLRAVMSETEVRAWYAAMGEHLDDEGRRKLEGWLGNLGFE